MKPCDENIKKTFLLVNEMLKTADRGDLDREDAIIKDTLVTKGGEIVQTHIRELLGLSTSTPEGRDV